MLECLLINIAICMLFVYVFSLTVLDLLRSMLVHPDGAQFFSDAYNTNKYNVYPTFIMLHVTILDLSVHHFNSL